METKLDLPIESISALQVLIRICIDSRDRLREAADKFSGKAVSELLNELASDRNQQVSELRTVVSANFIEPESVGTANGSGYIAWMKIRSALGSGDLTLLDETEKGENYLLESLTNAMGDQACSPIVDILKRHFQTVSNSLKRISEVRSGFSSTFDKSRQPIL